MCCEGILLRELHRRGYRLATQRELLLRVLHCFQGAASIPEIHAQASRSSPALDLSIIYRTLELFEALHLVVCPHKWRKTLRVAHAASNSLALDKPASVKD